MHLVQSIDPLYVFSGLCVGALVGMTGVGGGSLMTPLLILLFGVHPAAAVGTDLLYAAITKIFGTAVHGYSRTVEWRIVRRLATGSIPATALTLLALSHFDLGGAAGGAADLPRLGRGAARHRFDGRLPAGADRLLRRPPARARPASDGSADRRRRCRPRLLVSISSVGAGAIGVTLLLILYRQLPTPNIVGSDIAHAVPLTLLAGCGHWLLGSVDLAILGSLLTGSIPGIVLGSLTMVRVPDRPLRLTLATVLLVVGSRLVV